MFTLNLNKINGSELIVNIEESSKPDAGLILENTLEEVEVEYDKLSHWDKEVVMFAGNQYTYIIAVMLDGTKFAVIEDFESIQANAQEQINELHKYLKDVSTFFKDAQSILNEDLNNNNQIDMNDEKVAA